MKRFFKTGRVPAVVGLLLSFCLGMFVTATMAPRDTPKPEVEFYCDTFDLLPDGSLQVWMDIRVKNIKYFTGLMFNLDYNRPGVSSYRYFLPSKAGGPNNNEEITAAVDETSDFFRVASDLYTQGANPFDDEKFESFVWGDTYPDALSFSAVLQDAKQSAEDPDGIDSGEKVKLFVPEEFGMPSYLYIDTTEQPDGVTIGSLSFRLDASKVPDIVKAYEDNGDDGSALIQTVSIPDEEWGDEIPAWTVKFIEVVEEDGVPVTYPDSAYIYDSELDEQPVEMKYTFEFPDTLIRAELMEDYVRVNAWEAYASGDWSDVAALLQRYSGQIELGYANGNVKREVFPWGAANDPDSADPQPDYKIYQLNTTPADYAEATLNELTDADWIEVDTTASLYSPKNGVYKVEQYYCYTEDGEAKRYVIPATAYVVIDPVELTGAWADKLYLAKTNFETTIQLELPKDALLQTTPNLPKVSLPLSIDEGWVDENVLPTVVGTPVTYTPKFVSGLSLDQEAERVYPWITLGTASLAATRELLDSSVDQYEYKAEADRVVNPSDPTDVDGKFTIQKFRPDGSQVTMETDKHTVQIYLPNGVEVGQDWFNVGYSIIQNGNDYEVILDTGDVKAGHESQMQSLKSYLNLGGWFGVVVTDDNGIRSDKINVYLSPRENIYTHDEEYDFTGHQAGLLPLYASGINGNGTATVNPLSTTVTLPMGHFVRTLYDGTTGEPGGKLGVVKIQQDHWTVTPASMQVAKGVSGIFTHGPEQFKEVAAFDNYGSVFNEGNRTVIIHAQYDNLESGGQIEPEEVLNVYYDGVTNPEEDAPDVNVVYDAKQQGYIYRQEITLTLKNEGTTDVSGIYIDPDHRPFSDGKTPLRGHFEVLRAPAAYLPAGEETTFVLTYVYDLKYDPLNIIDVKGTTYRDTLAVGTNNSTAATTFTAQFRVTKGPVSKVKVVTIPAPDPTKPGGNIMGEAEVMVGFGEGLPNDITSSLPAAAPNTAPGSTTYEAEYRYVWIRATPDSEYQVYEVESVYYFNSEGNKIDLSSSGAAWGPYGYVDSTKPQEKYYYFEMPPHDTTVYVKFYEPTLSKLRLSKLLVYASEELNPPVTGWGSPGSNMIDPDNPEIGLQVLRRDDGTTNELLTYPSNTSGAPDSVAKLALTEKESSYPKFFSVLPGNAEYAQIFFSLRQTLEMLDLEGNVMNSALPEAGWTLKVSAQAPKLDGMGDDELVWNYSSTPNQPWQEGFTRQPTADTLPLTSEHFTYVFDAPDQGKERVVTIWLRYQKDDGTDAVERSFQVRLLRQADNPPNQLNYGNSPYGMIMADPTVGDKVAAKESFSTATADSPAYAFDPNLADTNPDVNLIPQLVQNNKMYQTYWAEAWSGTSNYDEHETALFAVVGETIYDPGFKEHNVVDGAGNQVPYSSIEVNIIADTLDTTAVTQVQRFGLGNISTVASGTLSRIYIGTLDQVCDSGVTWDVFRDGNEWRPGAYEMGIEYSFTDYDGSIKKLYRPLVIVAAPGDVNADGRMNTDSTGALDRKDEWLVEGRVTDPLGYTLDPAVWPYGELHRLRSCDTNNDCIMNNIDANAIKAEALFPYYLSDYKVATTDL